ncbi:MAG: beta-lactamase family protein [Rhodobacteraceae bacterium]|nr:beta-lactamase family protein [Paracoccaceae bacterium]
MRLAACAFAAFLTLVAAREAAPAGALPEATVAAIEAAVEEEMAAKNLPSVAVGVWIPARGAYVAAKGAADLDTGAERTVADPFRIASITKTMIGTVALQLAEEGALALDAPIATWFPDFPNAERITVDDLLRMRSGIVDSWTPGRLEEWYEDPIGAFSSDEMIALSAAMGDRFTPPDAETVYVNTNFNMLDEIIARVTGQATPDVMAARIFAPLGMAASEMPAATELPGPLRGYGWNAAAGRYEDKTELNPEVPGGAGSVISSLADLGVYVRALCTGALLSPQTQAARMRTEPFAGGNGVARYGQAVATLGPFCGHNGTIMGFSTEAWHLPAEDAVVVVNVNRLDADDVSMSGDLFGKLARAVFPDALR